MNCPKDALVNTIEASLGDSGDDDDEGPAALTMAMADDSDAGSAHSGDSDLDDMFDFDPDKMAELMNAGATVTDLADHLQDVGVKLE
eukprot:10717234-Heterocapsa_arctica.AAC.1